MVEEGKFKCTRFAKFYISRNLLLIKHSNDKLKVIPLKQRKVVVQGRARLKASTEYS
jgi:hypothetical protein